jgi:Sigma-70, region 4
MTARPGLQDYRQRQREETRLHVLAPLFIAALDGVKTPEQILLEREQAELLDRMIDRLKPPRMGLAVRYYYGIRCEPRSLEQVAVKFGVTRERIRQILNKACRILRRWILQKENPNWLRQLEDRERDRQRALDAASAARHAVRWSWLQEADRIATEARRVAEEAEQAKRRAQQARREYDYLYIEAHRVNALWPQELERRAELRRHELLMAEQRLHNNQRFEVEYAKKVKLEARLERVAKRNTERNPELASRAARLRWAEDDWLLWGVREQERRKRRRVVLVRSE